MCVCVIERERQTDRDRQTDTQTGRERERTTVTEAGKWRDICASTCMLIDIWGKKNAQRNNNREREKRER